MKVDYKVNYLVDIILVLTGLVSLFTGIIRFPEVLNYIIVNFRNLVINVNLLNTIHRWTGLALGILVILHFILHWRWVVSVTKRIFIKWSKK